MTSLFKIAAVGSALFGVLASPMVFSEDEARTSAGPASATHSTATQKKAANALMTKFPNAEMSHIGGGVDTRQGPHARALVAFGPAGFLAGRFKTEVVCADVSLTPDAAPVTAMFFISPKTQDEVLIVDTPVSDAACVPPKDKRRTSEGARAFRSLMEEHNAYSKNIFRSMFGT